VLIADDQVAMRVGIRRALESHQMRVVAEAANAPEALHAALSHRPDVCLLAVPLPGGGIEALQLIRDAVPETKIVMLTASDREDDLFAVLRAGADGYLLKTTPGERLPLAIEGVLRGEAALPRRLAASLIREFRERGRMHRLPVSVDGKGVELTSREFEVLAHLQHGDSTAQIAGQLQISEVTVRRHISAVLQKLQVHDRSSALELLAREES
jgi:DNA-binding NarL/FixJ family response regulator